MFRIGDIVQHTVTGSVGKVMGYGCKTASNTYYLTLKVRPLRGYYLLPMEDSTSNWGFVELNQPSLVPGNSLDNNKLAA